MDRKFKILKINHVAVAVNDNTKAFALFNLLGMDCGNSQFIENEKVNVVKVRTEDKQHTIELLEASDSSSVIKKFIDKKGQGLHHIALEVDDINEAIHFLIDNDINLIYKTPQKGADNKLITFIHPNSTPGILLELCQSE